jgi:hypothetical protein
VTVEQLVSEVKQALEEEDLTDEAGPLAWETVEQDDSPWIVVTIRPAGSYVVSEHPEWPLRFGIWKETGALLRMSRWGEAEDEAVAHSEILMPFEGSVDPTDHPWRPLSRP